MSVELLALKEYMSSTLSLCAQTVDLTTFAAKLVEKRFLDSSAVSAALDRQGATKMDSVRHLMDAVEAQIRVDCKKFKDFLDILNSFQSLEALAGKLECL